MRSEARGLGPWLLLVAVVGTLVAAPGAFVRSTTGGAAAVDEPYYLLTAISLAEDGDLDIDDELDTARWRAFHDATLPQQAAPFPDGRRVAPHDPLLSALLAGPYALGGLAGARWFLAVVNGLLAAALVHLLARRLAVPVGLAAVVGVVGSASVPFLVYGSQVYPELPAALAVTLAVDAALARPSRRAAAVVALSVVALPWLAVKYAPVAGTVAALHLWRLHRSGRRADVLGLAGVYAVAALTYVAGHLAWYGGLTVYAAGDFFRDNGGQLSVVGTEWNPLGRSRRLVGLLVDRDFGIASWQPAWLALPVALGALLPRRARPAGVGLLVAPLAVGWATATWVALTMHGFWFPGRQLVHVLPLALALVGVWLHRHAGPRARAVVTAAAMLGLWSSAALVVGGLTGELNWVVTFAEADQPLRRLWRLLLPDGVARPAGTALLTGAWAAALLGLGRLGARSVRPSRRVCGSRR